MAIAWGSWEYSDGNGMRVGVEASVSPSSPTTGNTFVTVTLEWYTQNQYPYSDSQTLTYTGNDTGSEGFTNSSGAGTVLRDTRLVNVAINYGSTQSKTYTATISGAYNGVTPSKSVTVTIPARPYAAPSAPTSVTASRTDDTHLALAWTRNPTTAGPYTSQRVQRSTNGGAYVTLTSSLSGTAATYTDATATAGNKYTYKIVAVNTAGTGTSTASSAVYTAPAAPTGAMAAKTAGGDITITWVNHVAYSEYTTRVEHSENGGAFTALATVATGLATYTHTSPDPTKTHAYRVRSATSSGTTIYSTTYSTTGTVALTTAPAAPTTLKPNGAVLDATGAITFTWKHVPLDTTPQTKFQVRHRIVGAGSWTTVTAVTSSVSSWVLAASTYANGDHIEWQVSTWGASASQGQFSASATITMSTAPTVTVSAPTGTIDTSTITATWVFYDAEGSPQSAWRAWLLTDADVQLEALEGSGDTATVTFTTRATDSSSYKVRVQVRDGDGLWSDVYETTFDAAFLPPEDIDLLASWDDVLGFVILSLSPQGAVEDVSEEAVSVDLQRRTDGGDWVTFATGLDPETVTADTTAATLGSLDYQVVATTAAGATAVVGAVSFAPGEDRWGYLSVGPGFGTVVRFYGNLSVTDNASTDSASFHFDRGDTEPNFPVAFYTVDATQKVDVSATIESLSSSPAEFLAVALTPSTALLRLPDGTRMFGTLSGVNRSQDVSVMAQVGFSVNRTATPAGF